MFLPNFFPLPNQPVPEPWAPDLLDFRDFLDARDLLEPLDLLVFRGGALTGLEVIDFRV
jgi:hypothetical protein